MSIVKLVVEERPLMFLGLPGITCLVMGVLFGAWLMNLYVELGRIVTNVALASIGFLLLGCFMISTAITLYAITRISKKILAKNLRLRDSALRRKWGAQWNKQSMDYLLDSGPHHLFINALSRSDTKNAWYWGRVAKPVS